MIENKKYKASYNFAFIDESTKKEIRRKLLKAVAIPGYQVPYSSPEMPIARGWGTGGLHITLAVIGKRDIFKIIDQGSDASVNACNLREFVQAMTGCKTTYDTQEATLIQTRHRITEEELREDQLFVFQVPQPEPLRGVERYENKTRQMHGEADYAKMWVSLYESFVQHGDIMLGAGYPVKINGRYIMAPSPIPRWDIPNLNHAKTLYLFGAGREKRLYAVPPHTTVEPLEFEDVKFNIEKFNGASCSKTGFRKAFLDELYQDDGSKTYVINDSNFLDKMEQGELVNQFVNPYLQKIIMSHTNEPSFLLRVRNLTKIYGEPSERTLQLTGPEFNSNICPDTDSIVACANINFDLYPGEVLGIVGESGSGKSTVVKLLYFDMEKTAGAALLKPYQDGTVNILEASGQQKRYIRNYLMGTVYQNPRDGLNFRFSSGGNIAEKLIMAGHMHVGQIRERASYLLDKTEVPVRRMDDLPSSFSGGMQQRVQIAKAIANNPPLLFLDEVTTGLDVSVQARVLDLIRELQQELGIAMIVVSHDLSVIRMLTDRTLVMKNGRIVESGLTDQILQDPQHAYTQLLVSSLL